MQGCSHKALDAQKAMRALVQIIGILQNCKRAARHAHHTFCMMSHGEQPSRGGVYIMMRASRGSERKASSACTLCHQKREITGCLWASGPSGAETDIVKEQALQIGCFASGFYT